MDDEFKIPTLPIIIGPAKKPDEIEVKQSEDSKTEEPKKLATEKFECPYKVPSWSGELPQLKYSFEVLKNGVIIEEIKDLQAKPYHIFGRLPVPSVDVNSAHPTTSRFHCILQYRPSLPNDESTDEKQNIEEGWYLYDLDSTHGTFLNKNRIRPKTFVRMRVGHQLKLGNSTRCYILLGPSEDEEEQSELTITELKQQKLERELEREREEMEKQLEKERIEKEKEEQGISWGMTEDAEEEPDLTENPFAQTNNEEIFISDPKKTLRGFFEREGHDLEYRCDELSPGVFICRVDLPVDDEYGKSVVCEVQHKGKKKECVVQCALEACRILDRHGVLRQANHEPRRAKKTTESDSDDDNFFDRTGDVEKKRMKKMGQQTQDALTYEQLQAQESEILQKIQELEEKLNQMIEIEKRQKQSENADDEDLDSFMSHLSHEKIDKFTMKNIKIEIQNLKLEHVKIQKLINIAKPSIEFPSVSEKKGKLPLFGKRKGLPRDFGLKKNEAQAKTAENEFQAEEEEEDDAQEVKNEKKIDVIEEKKIVSEEKSIEKQEDEGKTLEPPKKIQKLESDSLIESPNVPQSLEPEKQQQQAQKSQKKPRYYKNRNRYRANVDMNDDDEYIDEEKVSTWVAPENQKGDGTTHLNEKYGY